MPNYILLIIILSLTACQNESDRPTKVIQENNSIAIYGDGEKLTLKEIEDYILTMPRKMRWDNNNPKQWYEELIKKIIIQKHLLSEANLIGANESEIVKSKQRALSRQVYVDEYFAKFKDLRVTEQELSEFYEQNSDLFQLPEKRVVYHIFRYKNKTSIEEVEELRNRVINGESFKLLAEQYSDSESRHSQGLLGEIERNKFSKELDEIIFSLEKNNPSQVITTKDGYHIFKVADILKKKRYEFSQVKSLIKGMISEELMVNMIKEEAGRISFSDSINIPEYDLFLNLLKNSSTNLMNVGDFYLTTGQFILFLNELPKHNTHLGAKKLAYLQLEKIVYSEVIYQYMKNNKVNISKPEVLQQQLNELLIKEYSLIRVKSYINKHPELINIYFDKNKNRFSSSIKFKIKLLTIPLVKSKNLMNELELSIPKLNNNGIQLEDLEQKYSGEIKDFEYHSINELKQLDQRIISFINTINVGEHSFPYTTELNESIQLNDNVEIIGYYNIIKLIDKKESLVQPLALIREQVVNEFLNMHQSEILKKTNEDIINSIKIDSQLLDVIIENLQRF